MTCKILFKTQHLDLCLQISVLSLAIFFPSLLLIFPFLCGWKELMGCRKPSSGPDGNGGGRHCQGWDGSAAPGCCLHLLPWPCPCGCHVPHVPCAPAVPLVPAVPLLPKFLPKMNLFSSSFCLSTDKKVSCWLTLLPDYKINSLP